MNKLFFTIFLLSFSLITFSQINESKLKSTLIYKFAGLVEWNNIETIDTFKFLIYSYDTLISNELKKISETNSLYSKPIIIVSEKYNINSVQCIFIDLDHRKEIKNIYYKTLGKPILIITYSSSSPDLAMINMYKSNKEQTLNFKINKERLEQSKFSYNNKLLLFGGNIVDLQELYISVNKQLEKKSNKLDSINGYLNSLKNKSEQYQYQIDTMSEYINIISSNIKDKENEVLKLNSNIIIKDSNLKTLLIYLKKQEKQEKSLSQKLDKWKDSINSIEKNIIELNKALSDKKDEILTNQQIINNQKKEIKLKTSKIKSQKIVLILSIFMGIALLIALVSIFIALRAKKILATELQSLVKKRTIDLDRSKKYYQSLFENTPVAICEYDLHDLKNYLFVFNNSIMSNEIELPEDLIIESINKIKVNDANFHTLELFSAVSKQEFIQNHKKLFIKQSVKGVRIFLQKLLNGEKQFEYEITMNSFKNEMKHLVLSFIVLPEDKSTFSKVIVSFSDITELKIYEKEIIKHRDHLEELVKERTSEIIKLNESINRQNKELKNKNEDLSNKNRQLILQQKEISELNNELVDANRQLNEQKEELIDALNKLHKTQRKLIESEKFASLGMLTAGVAHEINNPINFISSGSQAIETIIADIKDLIDNIILTFEKNNTKFTRETVTIINKLKNEDYFYLLDEIIKNINMGVDRVVNIVNSLQSYSRKPSDSIEPFNIIKGIENSLTILKNKYKNRIEIIKNFKEVPEIIISQGKIEQVFVNILTNAIDAIKNKGTIVISTLFNNQKKHIEIIFEDSGLGIKKEYLNKIFDPFFTTKGPQEGTGLGMYITYGIIKQLNGNITIDSEINKGTKIKITLPV
jgi:signal transduction histidine kinase